ncbi:hypothetical protein CVT26_012358 [Gymnopilus dilepis]|uniref:Uncharacterized protein n=1 Tax=Gymnopilus dilepis TaxID=231916 RepID=A0A409WD91_9AGAR|nr:hypothetical protein CVT26_012358 [Gymnopilus dilepis]
MSFAHTNPPAYDAPSVTDDISNLMKNALEVQESLRKANLVLQHVDNDAGTDLAALLEVVDNKYVDLLNHSRESAAKLNADIKNFVDVVIPVAQNTQYPFAKRLDHVKKTARKISDAANDNSAPFSKEVDDVKKGLVTLRDRVSKLESQISAQYTKDVEQLNNEIARIAEAVKSNPSLQDRLGKTGRDVLKTFKKPATPVTKVQPATTSATPTGTKNENGADTDPKPFKFAAIFTAVSAIGKFFEGHAAIEKSKAELDAKIQELADIKKDVDKKNVQVKEAAQATSLLVKEFSAQIGKIGNFDAIWNKLNADAATLHDYLESQGDPDEQAFIEKINAEAPVYVKIREALDDYCLRVQ